MTIHTDDTLGLLKVSGPDANKLLQGQLTCDVNLLANSQYCLAALCNPQGRVVSLFYLIHLNDAYYLLMQQSMINITSTTLKKYAVFYKVILEDVTPELTNLLTAISNPVLFDIQAGIPRIHPETSGMFLPHDINLDQLGAINFEKGCYTGQEIIARMHYRAKLKKRMQSTLLPASELLQPGREHALGTIVDVSQQADQQQLLYIAPISES